jgi:hypothetical protein
MIVLVINVSTRGKLTSDASTSNSASSLLQIEDRFTGNSQQDYTVDIGLFPRELKNSFSAVVATHFGILSADCMLLDSPPTVVLRNYEKCLPAMKKLAEFMSFVIEFLKQNKYLKSNHYIVVDRILRDQNISEFFFNYYEKARSALQNIDCPESCVHQSTYLGKITPKYLLLIFHLEDQTLLDSELSKYLSEAIEPVLDRVFLSWNSSNRYFLFIKAIAVGSDKKFSTVRCSLPFSVFSTPAEVNEQLFPLFAMDVSIYFRLTLLNILSCLFFPFYFQDLGIILPETEVIEEDNEDECSSELVSVTDDEALLDERVQVINGVKINMINDQQRNVEKEGTNLKKRKYTRKRNKLDNYALSDPLERRHWEVCERSRYCHQLSLVWNYFLVYKDHQDFPAAVCKICYHQKKDNPACTVIDCCEFTDYTNCDV